MMQRSCYELKVGVLIFATNVGCGNFLAGPVLYAEDQIMIHNPSGRTMALGSTHPQTEMSTRNIYWR
jgi:hypothetical protein